MFKKLWIISIVLVILGTLAIIYFLMKGKLEPREDIYNAVPLDAYFLVEIKDFHDFLDQLQENSLIWQELCKMKTVKKADHFLSETDSLLLLNSSIDELISQNPVLVSAHNIGKKDTRLLFLSQLKETPGLSSFQNLAEKTFSPHWAIRERIYQKTKIFEVDIRKTGSRFYYAVYKGVIAFSSSSILVENALRQLDIDQNILGQKGFLEMKKTAGEKVDGNLYIHFKYFPRYLSLLSDPEHKNELYTLTRFSTWAELDINLKNDALLLNGFTYTDDSLNIYANIFKGQSPRKSSMDQILPANIVSYTILGLSNFERFFKAYKNYLQGSDRYKSFENNLKKAGKKWGADLPALILPQLEDEIGIAYPEVKNNSSTPESFVLFGLKSMTRTTEILAGSIENYCKKNKLETSQYILSVNIDSETRFPVFKLPVESMPELLFGNIFYGTGHQYVTFIDGYMVLGNSVHSLSSFIYDNVLQKTLSHELDYLKFKEALSDRFNFYFYLNVPLATGLIRPYLRKDLAKGLDKNMEVFQKLQALGFQFSNENRMIYNNIYLKYQPEFKKALETRWESLLDTTLRSKPILVKNHKTNDKEIFIQDEKNNIYLINSSGRILWKIGLPEKIMSKVYQIDYYKNKKLQYLFNTKSKIYLIDRNGNNVEKYPVKLRSKASNGLSLFDYDKNLDYRICLAGRDRRIYLYSKEGNLVNGWNPPRMESIITTPVYHFRVNKKDYIVVSDKYKFYILNRKGKIRVNVSTPVPKPLNQQIFLDKNSSPNRFVTTGTDGTVFFIRLDGKVIKKKMGEFSKDHYFEYRDLDGDRKNEYIFLDQKQLQVYHSSGKIRFSHKFRYPIHTKPAIYRFSSSDLKIGIVSVPDRKIYLFNKNGKLYKDFPLAGQTAFSIGKFKNSNSRFNLIVGGKDNYLYNYAVQ